MKNYRYFKNEKCEYYPCHKTDGDYFNCMFCFCPLYFLGKNCGGNFKILETGKKDCSDCLFIHSENGYDHVMKMLGKIFEKRS